MLNIELEDNEWNLEYIDHDRDVVRAIVFDKDGFFNFVRVERDDVFGHAVVIETSGGGVGLSWMEALEEYEKCKKTPLGRLIAQREVPILHRAKEIIEGL